jgi:transcriptional regulator with XRE-family HTH domain
MENIEEIGKRLGLISNNLFVSQKQFAIELGISPATLNQYIKGKNMPGGDLLSKIALLDVSINWLLTGKGDMQLTIEKAFETELSAIARPSPLFKDTLNIDDISSEYIIIGSNTFPSDKIKIKEILECNPYLVGYVLGMNLINYGIANDDTIVFHKLKKDEKLINEVVIVHKHYCIQHSNIWINEFFLRYYDTKSNKLLSGSKDLLPIDYDPEIVVQAKITAIIRPI